MAYKMVIKAMGLDEKLLRKEESVDRRGRIEPWGSKMLKRNW